MLHYHFETNDAISQLRPLPDHRPLVPFAAAYVNPLPTCLRISSLHLVCGLPLLVLSALGVGLNINLQKPIFMTNLVTAENMQCDEHEAEELLTHI